MSAVLMALAPAPVWAGPPRSRAESLVAEHLGVFSMRPERRDEDERVTLSDGRLEIWFLWPLRRAERPAALCAGARWLTVGRLRSAGGAAALFRAAPDVGQITLVLYAVERRLEVAQPGRYRRLRSASPRARVRLTRARAASLDEGSVDRALAGPGCAGRAADLLDEVWAR